MRFRRQFDPTQVGWRIGRAVQPKAGQLWCPWDRTTGAIGPQGSGKTLDLLSPALIAAPGAAVVTLTKVEDLLLTVPMRRDQGRPVVVCDPFAQAEGLPRLVWDPVAGCVDPAVAERRAKAFVAGTVRAAARGGSDAAQFYAGESAKVLQCFFHAAALAGYTLAEVQQWVSHPPISHEPGEILATHPAAAPLWHGMLQDALTGDERTVGNTTSTLQQAMAMFFQPTMRKRCVPSPGHPATDIADLILRRGTFYLLGRDDPHTSVTPLMTALTEHILDTALKLANESPHGRLCPPMLAVLDELPSTAPLPTLRTRMANERALGISFIYAAQTWRQLAALYGDTEARALLGLTNVLIVFGGSKDTGFNKEISDLVGSTRVTRTTWQHSGARGSSHGDDMLVLTPEEIRRLPDKHALVIAENSKPILARLTRCIEGHQGRALLERQLELRAELQHGRRHPVSADARAVAALAGTPPAPTQESTW